MPLKKTLPLRAILIWALVAGYTYILPNFRVIYEAILNAYGVEVVGKVPLAIVAAFGAAYVLATLRTSKNLKNLLYLLPAALIAYIIMTLEPNPNKHIHIPQYVVMTWLLLAALSRDYKGKGLLVLIFILASLLGVVDELEQGIHPARFYGWSDMLVNCSSSLIGVLTILGIKPPKGTDRSWVQHLKKHQDLIGLALFGLLGAGLMCFYLFSVQAQETFRGVYPGWLLVWNAAYLLLAPVIAYRSLHRQDKALRSDAPANTIPSSLGLKTARLWLLPLLVILFYMHAILVFVALTGVKFR